MQRSARAVVIGGGVAGVSTLYHLARKGWTDTVLLERRELTSGSTWHAAGLLPLFNLSYSVGTLHRYSLRLYRQLQEEGPDLGLKLVSNIRLAACPDRMDEYRHYAGVAGTIGVEVEFLSPAEVAAAWPLCRTEGLLGAIRHPGDGYVQPADLTQALARRSREMGATIHRRTPVEAIDASSGGGWTVRTPHGDIRCEHVISCTGNHARRTGEMVGLDIPVLPVEHHYIVTEEHPELLRRREQGLPEQGVLREPDAGYYLREEAGGLLLGCYEAGAPCCYLDGPSPDSEYELFNADLDRLMPHIEACMKRVPAFSEVGIKAVYNGAIAYTPDGNPVVGPAWDLGNFWLNEGHSFGITSAGGAGWQLAEWIVEGEPTVDMLDVDPRRFGPYATRGYLRAKNEEAYANVYTVHYPDEERPAARPLKRSPCYERMAARGAVFGQVYGWERPNWFAPPDYRLSEADLARADTLLNRNYSPPGADGRIVERYSFRRSNYWSFVGEECRHVQRKVGVLDMSAFAKYLVTGPGAAAWLESIFANRIPRAVGRLGLCHMLSLNGGVRAEFTVYRRGAETWYLVGAGAMERHDWDYLSKLAPDDGSVRLQKVTARVGVLVVAGPSSRALLSELTDTDLSNDRFPWFSGRRIDLGCAWADALRVNFVGELGWELHHPIEMQNRIFDELMRVGEPYELRPFGIRAMDSMRLEKSYRVVGRELSIEYAAIESGLQRFVRLDKEPGFIGQESLRRWRDRGFANGFVTLRVRGAEDADARGSEALYRGGDLVGRATSGGYGFRLGESLALGIVRSDCTAPGTELEIDILGRRRTAEVVAESPYDPHNRNLRA